MLARFLGFVGILGFGYSGLEFFFNGFFHLIKSNRGGLNKVDFYS